jgi:tetratricopeptide (TPR) repeat protein
MSHQPTSFSLEETAQKALSLHHGGRLDEAASLYDQILEAAPDHPEILYFSGALAAQTGDYALALERLNRAAGHAPHVADIHYNIGVVLKELGRFQDAAEAYRRAIEINPDFPDAHNNLGFVLQSLNRLDDAADAYRRALKSNPGYVEVRTNLALLLKQCGDLEGAAAEFKRALEKSPGNRDLEHDLRDTYCQMVPAWHFPMLNDRTRNETYQQAITKAVRPDDIVLDIGSGTGLLAMIAARAGAKHVYACEVVKPIAEIARRIIADNGYADKITVIDKLSTELEIGKDIPEPATLLISEILDNALLGEGVLPTLRHANACLISSEARIIPASAVVWGTVIQCPEFKTLNTAGDACDFNLDAFNYFRHTSFGFDWEREDSVSLTHPFEILRLDFRDIPEGKTTRDIRITATAEGTAQAVVVWFDLTLIDDIVFSTRIGERHNHWHQVIFLLDNELPLKPEQTFTLTVGHTDKKLIVDLPSRS